MKYFKKLRALFRKEKLDRDMAEEMRFHLNQRAAELGDDGMPPDEARYAAQRKFGNAGIIQERARDQRGFLWLEQFGQDLRYAFRQVRRSPGFAFVSTFSLALGIATAATMFTFFSAVLLRPMPFLADESTLVRIRAYHVKDPGRGFDNSTPDVDDMRRELRGLSGVFALTTRTFVVRGDESAERAVGAEITHDAFHTLGVRPALGRLFLPEEGRLEAVKVTLLSHALWQRAFGGRADLIGQTIILNNVPTTVVGIMPEGFGFPENNLLWQPLPAYFNADDSRRVNHFSPTYARMTPGATLQQVQAELDALAARLERDHAASNAGLRFRVFPLHDEATRRERRPLELMLGGSLVVLLITSTNLATLLLVRAASRAHEIALRSALGAARSRVIRQLMTENLVLGGIGGVAALPLAALERNLLLGFTPVERPAWISYDFDWRVIAFAVAVTGVTSIFFGLIPAWHAARADVSRDLKAGSRSLGAIGGVLRLRRALVIGQLALAVVLLAIGGLMARSFWRLQTVPTGFIPDEVLTFRTGISGLVDNGGGAAVRFFEGVEQRLRETPGVESAGFVSYLPMQGRATEDAIRLEGQPEPRADQRQFVLVRAASPGAFTAMRIPLHRGRLFNSHDRPGQPPIAIVDETFVRKYFAGEDPIGRRVTFDRAANSSQAEWLTIVGVVGDVRQYPAVLAPVPNLWRPLAQHPDNFMNAVVRVHGEPAAFARTGREAVSATRADIPVFNVMPLTKAVRDALWPQRLFSWLLASFAGMALLLAGLGIYGVTAYAVSQRTQEIGVRLALGARPAAIAAMIFRQCGLLIAGGLAIGLVGAWGVAPMLSGQLYGTDVHDLLVFIAVPAILAATALVACWLPAWRAMKVDPMVALRCE